MPDACLSVNLHSDTARALREQADRQRLRVTDAVGDAIALWDLACREWAKGHRIVIVNDRGLDGPTYREIEWRDGRPPVRRKPRRWWRRFSRQT